MATSNLGLLLSGTTSSFFNTVGRQNNDNAVDSFNFNIVTPSNFNASLHGFGLTNSADLLLFRDLNNNGVDDGNEESISTSSLSSNYPGSNASINQRNLEPGSYFLEVINPFTINTTYQLDLSNTGNDPSNLLPAEEDLGILTTTPIVRANTVTLAPYHLDSKDAADVFRFTLATAGGVNASLTGSSPDSDIDLRLIRDANNNGQVDPVEIVGSSTNPRISDEAISINSLPAGNYFLQPYLYSGVTTNSGVSLPAPYTLRVSSAPTPIPTSTTTVPTPTPVPTSTTTVPTPTPVPTSTTTVPTPTPVPTSTTTLPKASAQLVGSNRPNLLSGSDGGDTLVGLDGNDTLTGSGGADTFTFTRAQGKYSRKMGIDHITDFQHGIDKIDLNQSVFHLGSHLSFVSVRRDSLASTSHAAIVYSRSSGSLYYNANGALPGLGNGGKFAIVNSDAPLTRSDLELTSFR